MSYATHINIHPIDNHHGEPLWQIEGVDLDLDDLRDLAEELADLIKWLEQKARCGDTPTNQ
jgi:hypothetical protein